VLSARRSWRQLERPTLGDCLDVVSAATLVDSKLDNDPYERSRSSAASAGALQSVSVVILRPGAETLPLRIDPWGGALQQLRVTDRSALRKGTERLLGMLAAGRPSFVILLGDTARLATAYTNPESLLWRDAGALMATLHLCASATGLGFCPLGALGTEIRDTLFPGDARVVACGTAAIGVAGASV
jgi:hypothetical protein